ncbi:bifunctional diaminohydroxyphosphoribosylaminopyrimidine deaminase/5-amino-6-(5-phosphoribosylamino)uracil reductase RibD, partial [archaeon]
MRRALLLASQGAGRTSPNPCVGCVLVNNRGKIVGEGWHERSGLPHAEVVALSQAGDEATNCTAYVTLEPCNHYGRTPPCTLALVRGGVSRVVAGMVDPDPRVSGQGLQCLRVKGLHVQLVGDAEYETCKELNAAFIHRVIHQRPYVSFLVGFDVVCHAIHQLGGSPSDQQRCMQSLSSLFQPSLQDMDSVLLDSDSLRHFSESGFAANFAVFLHGLLPGHVRILLHINTTSSVSETVQAYVMHWVRQRREVYLLDSGSSSASSLQDVLLTGLARGTPPCPVHRALCSACSPLVWQPAPPHALQGVNGLLYLPLQPHNVFFTPLNDLPSIQRLVSLGCGEDEEGGEGG